MMLKDKIDVEQIKELGVTESIVKYILETETGRLIAKSKGEMVYYVVRTIDHKEYVIKTFNGQIIRDKKDKGYKSVMEVRGLESWYIDNVIKLEVIDGEFNTEYVPFNELLSMTRYIKDCEMVQYAYYKEGEIQTVLVNIEEYKELNYKEINKCIDVATNGYHKHLVALEYRKVR